MDNVTLNIFLALLISFFILALVYLGIMLIVVPYWDKKDEKKLENKDENEKQNEDQNKSNGLKYGAIVSTIKDSEDNSYKVVFDPDKGLLVPMVAYYINSYNQGIPYIYYMKIPMDVLKEIYDNFKNEVNKVEENYENEKNV